MQSHQIGHRAGAFCLGVTALFGAAETWAQSQAQEGASATLEEIVVTAEKRAEGLQNIPIAITAVTGSTLEKAGVEDVGDLTQLTPSLQFGQRSGNTFIALRGIGQAGQDIGSQSGVTVSLDGVPLLNHFMMNPSFLDIERVEVLRGPQGTIQGRNATGGAINVNSNSPEDEFASELAATVGNYSRRGLKGFVNAPLISDRLSARVAFQTDQADGWLKNGFNGRRNEDTDLTQVRGSLLATLSDSFTVRAIVEGTRDRSDPSFSILFGRARPDLPSPSEAGNLPRNDLDGLTVYFDQPNRRDVEDFRSTLIARWEVTPDIAITSTTGYIKHDIEFEELDNDLTTLNTSSFPFIGLYAKQVTQEFTATADLGSRADVVAGVFYMQGESSEPLYISAPPVNNAFIYLPREELDSYAIYAQFRYQLTDSLRATIGGRHTIDDKSFDINANSRGTIFINHADDSWEAFTPRFVLDYTPSENALIYASASRGFKSGGFNTLGDVSQPVNVFDPEYVWNYELGGKATFFEKKLRMGLTGFHADYTNLQQTVFRINPQTGVRYPKVENASTATIDGVELEVEAIPYPGLKLTGSATRLEGEYGRFFSIDPIFPELGNQDLGGNTTTQAPKWQLGTSGEYNFPISNSLEMTARVDYKWQSKVYFDIYNDALNVQDSYGLLNASLALSTADNDWSLSAWIRNASDERYLSQANVKPGAAPSRAGSLGTPRMYGATLTYRF